MKVLCQIKCTFWVIKFGYERYLKDFIESTYEIIQVLLLLQVCTSVEGSLICDINFLF